MRVLAAGVGVSRINRSLFAEVHSIEDAKTATIAMTIDGFVGFRVGINLERWSSFFNQLKRQNFKGRVRTRPYACRDYPVFAD